MHFYPKDPKSGMIFSLDPGARIPDPYHIPNSIYLQDFTFEIGEKQEKSNLFEI
jgi:hypothetical protein